MPDHLKLHLQICSFIRANQRFLLMCLFCAQKSIVNIMEDFEKTRNHLMKYVYFLIQISTFAETANQGINACLEDGNLLRVAWNLVCLNPI